ncbi:MAG: sigma-70 family RNA polymerase sigma factor [Methylobacteriaceae bacterium]|nr:sigma-70 family RNA polymerase sigma factor [Methylobacteriaceae bacterium]
MRRALAGSAPHYDRALRTLAQELRRGLAAAGARSGLDAAAIEDIVQDTLLAIHLKRQTWDPTRPLLPWARAIADHKRLDALRRRRRRGVEVEVDTVADVLPQDVVPMEDRLVPIERGLALLSPRQRQVVEALAVDGTSVRETAAQLRMTENGVRVTLHRALAALETKFAQWARA